MKKRILVYIILVQIITVAVLAFNIYQKKKQVLGTVSVSSIKKEDIVSSSSGELRYFYEPKSNSNDPNVSRNPDINPNPIYTINADSLNERYSYSIGKSEGTFRIITLGDSFTFGMHVDTKDNWTELLEDRLNLDIKCENINKFEVINLGVWGYDTAYTVERFKKRGQKYNSDLVLWFIVDLLRVDEEMRSLSQKNINDVEFSIFNSWNDRMNNVIGKYGKEQILKFQEETIKNLDKYFQGKLVLFSNPTTIDEKMSKILKNTALSRKNWTFAGSIKSIEKEDMRFPDFHPNQKGHKMIAEDIFNYLQVNKLIPCN